LILPDAEGSGLLKPSPILNRMLQNATIDANLVPP